ELGIMPILSSMTLTEYCAARQITVAELERRAGLKPGHLDKVARGERDVSMPVARRIHKATGGVVTPTDLAFSTIRAKTERGLRHRRLVSAQKGRRPHG
ncbi:MAG: helix-turn-helix domain-containing protein, partial [Hyphomonadaceae bacterium]